MVTMELVVETLDMVEGRLFSMSRRISDLDSVLIGLVSRQNLKFARLLVARVCLFPQESAQLRSRLRKDRKSLPEFSLDDLLQVLRLLWPQVSCGQS